MKSGEEGVGSSETVTRGIRVQVVARYTSEHSRPLARTWLFLYTVRITNESDEQVQLISRHWKITDANNHTEEVRGPGVVGEQPVLRPGQSYEYTSSCPLPTPYGTMEGTYQMVTGSGERFDARIAPFFLSEPYTIN